MAFSPKQLVSFVQEQFGALANPDNAAPMGAYMKTSMPFYGITKPNRIPVFREMKKQFMPSTQREYAAGVRALWKQPHREEKYAALQFARQHTGFVTMDSLPLYEKLIREGAWWDLVDETATKLVGRVQLLEGAKLRPVLRRWIDDKDLWIRRTALIAQIGHKDNTDAAMLFEHCLRRAHEKEFFIRKAIGWALRDYSYTAPEAVRDFLIDNRARLSGLSLREGAKQLLRENMLQKDEILPLKS